MPVKERLREYLKHEKISHTEFGKAINVSNSYINGIRRSIQPDKIFSIAKKYTNLNIEWLLTGKGEMLKNTSETIQKTEVKDISESETIKELIAAIKRRDEDVAALIRTNDKYADNLTELLKQLKKTDARPECDAANAVAI